jgi:predicted DNA-binding transcriptional regulator AlpA
MTELLPLKSVLARTGYGRTMWYRAIKAGQAPRPIKRGKKSLWVSDDIDGLIRGEVDAAKGVTGIREHGANDGAVSA